MIFHVLVFFKENLMWSHETWLKNWYHDEIRIQGTFRKTISISISFLNFIELKVNDDLYVPFLLIQDACLKENIPFFLQNYHH